MTQPAGSAPRQGPVALIVRAVLLVAVIIAAVTVYMQWTVRTAYEKSKANIESAMPTGEVENPEDALYLKDVAKHLTGDFQHKTDPQDSNIEIYEWKGVLQTYRLRLQHASNGFVEKVLWY